MDTDYNRLKISKSQAAHLAKALFDKQGHISCLPGELDFNFKISSDEVVYVLKISRPDVDEEFVDFQQQILNHVAKSDEQIQCPKPVMDVGGNWISRFTDDNGNDRLVRLLTWVEGRVWSGVNPQSSELLYSLGQQAGLLSSILQNFEHHKANRVFEWDIAQSQWTCEYLDLFDDNRKQIVSYFQDKFETLQGGYSKLRKSVVHNDANDNNIIVSTNSQHPKVEAIVDYGDAIYTQTINDLAIVLAYAVMNKPDVLSAAREAVKGYNKSFSLLKGELPFLYTLVAMRLVITVTKAAINKQNEPENEYLLISEKAAWDVLHKWMQIDENLAHFHFRDACGFSPHPDDLIFKKWAAEQSMSVNELLPTLKNDSIHPINLSIGSTWLGSTSEFSDYDLLSFKLKRLQQKQANSVIAGGYLEARPIYSTNAFKQEGNNGPEYRTVHLGVDFWVPAQTEIHALFEGTVFSIFDNANDKDYGPTLILEHQTDNGLTFFSLYGHMSRSSLALLNTGDFIQKSQLIGYIGAPPENGNWAPHLHFQLMLDMLGNMHDFPGVALPDSVNTWKSICPDPNLIFDEQGLKNQDLKAKGIAYRKKHLGKSLSLSYDQPLKMLRGEGAYLFAENGRKYLDTVNNVAHVGHEQPRVVRAGQQQMAVLNTNTRYLHENINTFAWELLSTFPEELSVVHFVNSGSEANELALRMVQAYTGQKDMIAVEVGYHGNTNACVEISSYKFDGQAGKGAPEHTHIVPLPDRFRGMYQGEDSGPKYAHHLQQQIENIHAKNRGVGGFICESIMSCGGQIELPDEYLKIAYESVRRAGGLCISDEVQVGCGRVGSHFWGFQLHGVVPDIVTIGKPIGNGHPLAAVVCTQKVAEAFADGMEYFNTFGGNPVSCAIGLEVLRVIRDEKLQQNALEVGNYLKSGLTDLQKEFPIIANVRGQGLFMGFELADSEKNPLTAKAVYLANRMKDLGILMSTDGKDNNVLKIKPPMVFSKENSDELLSRLATVFKEDYMKQQFT